MANFGAVLRTLSRTRPAGPVRLTAAPQAPSAVERRRAEGGAKRLFAGSKRADAVPAGARRAASSKEEREGMARTAPFHYRERSIFLQPSCDGCRASYGLRPRGLGAGASRSSATAPAEVPSCRGPGSGTEPIVGRPARTGWRWLPQRTMGCSAWSLSPKRPPCRHLPPDSSASVRCRSLPGPRARCGYVLSMTGPSSRRPRWSFSRSSKPTLEADLRPCMFGIRLTRSASGAMERCRVGGRSSGISSATAPRAVVAAYEASPRVDQGPRRGSEVGATLQAVIGSFRPVPPSVAAWGKIARED